MKCRFDAALAAAVLIALLAIRPAPAAAQDWRTVTTMRQHADEERLHVDVDYGGGSLTIEPAASGVLYRARFDYDAEQLRPETDYEPGRLHLALSGERGLSLGRQRASQMALALGPDTRLDLDFAFGGVEADLELGGLRIERLRIATGASETTLRFSRPSPARGRLLSINAGAAAFQAHGLGNANVEELHFDGGVGDITLDFTGAWTGDMTGVLDMGVGSLTLRLPRGLAVRIRKDAFLSSFDAPGLTRRGEEYYSDDWDDAEHRLTLDIDAALGSIRIQWVDPAAVPS